MANLLHSLTEGAGCMEKGRFKYSNTFISTYLCTYLYRFSGNGLASITDYETWKPRRRIYEHSFNKRYVQVAIIIIRYTARMCDDHIDILSWL